MSINTVIFDLGGVLLTNGWDHEQRAEICGRFSMDLAEFERRHGQYKGQLDDGTISLGDYVERAAFSEPKLFTKEAPSREEFIAAIQSVSKPFPEMLDLAKSVRSRVKCRLYTINNECRELHDYRVKSFGLSEIFTTFFCSGYMGTSKPGLEIFQRALGMLSIAPSEIVFVDDREKNLVSPKQLGFNVIHHKELKETSQTLMAMLGH